MNTVLNICPSVSQTPNTEPVSLWDYVVCDARGQTLVQQGSVSLQSLPEGQRTCTLVIPRGLWSEHTVTLPHVSKAMLSAAIAGTLEESLLDDPAALHLALYPNTTQGLLQIKARASCTVVAIDKAWLKALVQQLSDAGITVGRIALEQQAPGDTTQTGQDKRWQQLLASAAYADQQQVDLAQFDLQAKSARWVRVQQGVRQFLDARQWRSVRWALIAIVLVQLVCANLWAWQARAVQSSKREQIIQLLRLTFPQTQVVLDATKQMQQGVAALRAQSGALSETDFESLFLKQSLQAPNSIDYANGELKVQ